MGAAPSRPAARGLIISFDALGTLYKFRKPVATQYLEIARKCGLKAPIELPELERSFRAAYKATSVAFPNYGKENLQSPEVWWTKLVNEAFQDVVNGEELPQDLGSSMYEHFSSAAAYELYPDVRPFLDTMQSMRAGLSDPDGPMVMLGVITNSDPRVKRVLQSMNVRMSSSNLEAASPAEQILRITSKPEEFRRAGLAPLVTPWHDFWNAENDFDFLATSYAANSEKPDPGIFRAAWKLADLTIMSRAEQQVQPSAALFSSIMTQTRMFRKHVKDLQTMTWIHVGDDYIKDYLGAQNIGFDALHLHREGEAEPKEGANTITSLGELSAIVNLMKQNIDGGSA